MRTPLYTLVALSALFTLPAYANEPAATQSEFTTQAIQTKPFSGATLALTQARVVGQILNVEFIWTPPKKAEGGYQFKSTSSGSVKDFAYIDETTSKRITLLRDENGKYMTDPIAGTDGKSGKITINGSNPKVIALKFPAPPETSPTITIDFPGAGSFYSVPVSR
ncbi:phosphoribosylglycinamide synthetase [Aggregatibacter kilianii]|uniref:phosphoribosylglycinamide synthetase n=1 Tax=Aggregatibacter kilianii TaxID=2025884 RepID=UPI000D65E62C|nr:phosphoribosylglycinamide synthetase [Aggregatibacter kilianii]